MVNFMYKTTIKLKDTDATGVLYFAQQFSLALEAFEYFLKISELDLGKIIQENSFLLPIVHAESDYFFPLYVGDEIEITPTLARLGVSSFTMEYKIIKKGVVVGKTSIVHVAVLRSTGKSQPLPEKLLTILRSVPQPVQETCGSV